MGTTAKRRVFYSQAKKIDPNIAGKGYYFVPDIMTYLFTTKALSDTAKRALWAILNKTLRFHRSGYIIKNKDISLVTGINGKNVGRYLSELEDKKIISIRGDRIELILNHNAWILDTFTRRLVNERLEVTDAAVESIPDEDAPDDENESEESLLASLGSIKLC